MCNDVAPLHADVAAYDPETDVWRALPDAPEPVRWATGPVHWTGTEVLLGATPGRAPWRLHAWDPFTGEVRSLAELIGPPSLGATVWTGSELVAIRTPDGRPDDRTTVAGVAYEPASDTWRVLPDVEPEATRDLEAVWTGSEVLVWGGTRWGEGFAGGVPARSASGVVFDPTGHTLEPPSPEGDFAVGITVEVDGVDAPLRAETGEPGPLPLGGTAEAVLWLEATEDVYLQVDPERSGAGVVETGEGRLIVVGQDSGWGRDEAHPQLGLQVHGAGLVPVGFLPAGRPLPHVLTVKADEAPFAPAEGEYTDVVEVEWWRQVPPPEPYPTEPDGTATVRFTYTVSALTDAERADRTGERAAQEALARPPCHADRHRIAAGDLAVEIDGLGWFGIASYGAKRATFGGADLVFESMVFLDGRPLRECIHPTFSFEAHTESGGPDQVVTTSVADGFDLRVTHEVGDGALVQRFELTNTTDAPRAAVLVRYLEERAEDEPGGYGPAPVGRAGEDGSELSIVRDDGVRMAVAGDLDGDAVPERWAIGELGWLPRGGRVDVDPIPALGIPAERHGSVTGNAEGVGVAQQWTTEVAPGATAVFTTITRFTSDQ